MVLIYLHLKLKKDIVSLTLEFFYYTEPKQFFI